VREHQCLEVGRISQEIQNCVYLEEKEGSVVVFMLDELYTAGLCIQMIVRILGAVGIEA
jgi:hypothetical protein